MRAVHYKSAVQDCNFCMDTMLSLLAHTKEDFFMLYNVVVNDWGETTYVPTALGNVLLVVVLIALLAVAVVFARKQRNKTGADDVDQKMAHSKLTVKQLAFCAMAIALGTVLSNIKLFHFPTGGSNASPSSFKVASGRSRRSFAISFKLSGRDSSPTVSQI